jgi:hypothetical protein
MGWIVSPKLQNALVVTPPHNISECDYVWEEDTMKK